MKSFGLVLAVIVACVSVEARAQTYPSKAIRLVVTYPAGGSTDTVGRLVGEKLAEMVGQPVVIENIPGASGTIGAAYAAKAAPDGYTLLLVAGAHALNQSQYIRLSYDIRKDFAPIGLTATSSYVLVLNPSAPANSVMELIAAAKAQSGRFNFGSSGVGSTPHLAAQLFCTMADIVMTNVPYKGDAPVMTDILGGHIDLAFLGVSAVAENVRSGKLKALGVTSTERISALPNVPTIADAGVPGYEFSTWWGLLAPAGTPQAVIDRLAQYTAKLVALPGFKERLAPLGIEASGSPPEEFGAFIKSEVDKYAAIAKAAGIKPH